MKHNEIFDLIRNTPGLKSLSQWNQNLPATSYEWSRDIKKRGETNGRYEISVSKTISVNINSLFRALIEEGKRNKWLKDEKIIIRKSTENKSARITWSDYTTSLNVDFYSKGEAKSQIVVQHMKITDPKMANQMKEYWNSALLKLKAFLEK